MSSQQEEIDRKLVEHLVNRFLGWRLPKDFHPDCGIMFMDVYDNGTEQGGKFEPVGTNLFTAEQAKEMFRFLLENEDGTSVLTSLTEAHKVEMEKMAQEIYGHFSWCKECSEGPACNEALEIAKKFNIEVK